MSKSINIDSLSKEIAKALEDFSADVVERVDESSDRIAKEAIKELKSTSPRDRGRYHKAWRRKNEKAPHQPTNRIIYVAAPHYRLSHLLEYGHALKDGGRSKAQPHIAPVEENAIAQFEKEVKEAIKNG